MSPYKETQEVWNADTSPLSSAKLAFGSVMSELLDSSSAGISLPTRAQRVSTHIAAAMSDKASHPAEHHGSPVSLSSWQLHTPQPFTCSFSLTLYFPALSRLAIPHFKGGKKCRQMTQTLGLYESPTQLLIPRLSSILPVPIQGFFSCLFPHFEATE